MLHQKDAVIIIPTNRQPVQVWSLTKRVLGQPTIYICCVFSLLSAALQAIPTQNLMLLFLKNQQKVQHYTQAQVNTLPLGVQALGIVAELGASLVIDRLPRHRVTVGLTLCGLQAISAIILLVPTTTLAAHFAAFYLAATAYSINPLLYGWINVIVARGGDDAARSVVIAAMVASGFLLWTFWGIVLYPADDAPYWRDGYIALLCIIVALSGWLFVVRWVSLLLHFDLFLSSGPPIDNKCFSWMATRRGSTARRRS